MPLSSPVNQSAKELSSSHCRLSSSKACCTEARKKTTRSSNFLLRLVDDIAGFRFASGKGMFYWYERNRKINRKAGHIIFNHCSLWSSDRRMNLIRSCWERQSYFSSVDWHKRFWPMLGNVTLAYDWRQRVPKTGPLREVYDYPIHTGQTYQYKGTFFDLMRYTRSVGAHTGAYSNNGNEMQEYDVEPIISMIFLGIFSKLQKEIYGMGLEERLQDK